MSLEEYTKLINKNTIFCWEITVGVLCLAHIFKGMFGLDSWGYVFTFITVALVPLLLCKNYNAVHKDTEILKYYFSIGYLVFYTFILSTTDCSLTFVYILPMIVVILVYCDKRLILGIFAYTIIVNIINIALSWETLIKIKYNSSFVATSTFWEIQIITLVLTGIFTYKTSILLRRRDEIMEDMLDDLYTDDLTDIRNIRFMEDNMKKIFNWERWHNLSIAFIDIDNFKNFNTIYGHSFGDKVLITAAQLMDKCCKNVEGVYAIRVGGDEFILVGVDKNEKEFYEVADDIRKKIQDCKVEFEGNMVGICISIGIAHKYSEFSCNSFMELYNKADTRNNLAKTRGKNIIVVED